MSDLIRKSDALAAAQDASDSSDDPQDVVSAIAALPAESLDRDEAIARAERLEAEGRE